MKLNRFVVLSAIALLGFGSGALLAQTSDPDQTDVTKEFQRREENAQRLSVEDQLKLRAAQQKAMENAEVKAALEKRDKAIVDFRASLRAAMIAADPSVKPILEKIAGHTDAEFPVRP